MGFDYLPLSIISAQDSLIVLRRGRRKGPAMKQKPARFSVRTFSKQLYRVEILSHAVEECGIP
jgi:hypothetical protein